MFENEKIQGIYPQYNPYSNSFYNNKLLSKSIKLRAHNRIIDDQFKNYNDYLNDNNPMG